jgi:hypothetical protein
VHTVLVNIIVLVLLVVLAEGLFSVVLLSSDLLRDDSRPERLHTRYDPELGWAPIPNLYLPDLYGPGVYLRTNSQGFRGSYDYTEAVPSGMRRVICSGDSVTFGVGVDNEHSWCRLLATIDPHLETINMALPGYGVDQAYLSYKRDAVNFKHQVHLFAPITDDFRRMQSTKFIGYDRPLLVAEGDRLVATNVPFQLPWLNHVRRSLWSLRSVQAVRRLKRSLVDGEEETAVVQTKLDQPTRKIVANRQAAGVVSLLLRDLKALNQERGSILVFVYLPTHSDRGPETDYWIGVAEAECERLGIPFINVAEPFNRMSEHGATQLYLPDLGHFNRAGNQYVALLIYERLSSFPEVARVLFGQDRPRREALGRQARNRTEIE